MENVLAKNTLLAINVINALPDFSDFPNAKVVKITNSCPIFILHLFKKSQNVDAAQKELWTVLVTKMEFALAKNM